MDFEEHFGKRNFGAPIDTVNGRVEVIPLFLVCCQDALFYPIQIDLAEILFQRCHNVLVAWIEVIDHSGFFIVDLYHFAAEEFLRPLVRRDKVDFLHVVVFAGFRCFHARNNAGRLDACHARCIDVRIHVVDAIFLLLRNRTHTP